jgi:hypothetical protein
MESIPNLPKRPNGIPEGATFVDRKDKLITEGYVPPI